jgi:hypothetical protein
VFAQRVQTRFLLSGNAIEATMQQTPIADQTLHTMAQKSKFFRVAVEGATTDGRKIDRAQIEQMAKNFNPAKYGARIWLEHFRGIYPDSSFRAYGDVTAVKAEEVEIDGQKKMALFAQIEPLPDLVAMTNKAKQKIYTSIEMDPQFAGTGEAYLVGLGVTDTPASLGTEILAFASQNQDANPFKGRKTSSGTLFSEATEVTLDWEPASDPQDSKFSDMLKSVKDTLSRFSSKSKQTDDALLAVVKDMAEGMETMSGQQAESNKALKEMSTNFTALKAEHDDLKKKFDQIDTTDPTKFTTRPKATGGDGKTVVTDC